MTFRSLVLRAAGTNCDQETGYALELAGSEVDVRHLNQVLADGADLSRYQLIAFPGGFTFGDDVASGAVFSYTVLKRMQEPLQKFVDRGGLVVGICNGFQILVRLGLLPGNGGEAALVDNLSSRYEDRWVRARSGSTPGPWFEPNTEYLLPVAHGEGRFEWFPSEDGATFPENQIALTYIGDQSPAAYPANPNGAYMDIAGITNPTGNVLGLMPHPERFIQPTQHPYWTRFRGDDGRAPGEADLPVPLGLEMFRRVVAKS